MTTRRKVMVGSLAGALALATRAFAADNPARALKRIHERIGGRFGVHVLDSQSGARFGSDENSRYAMASTFKLPLAAALLWQIDHGAFRADRALALAKEDLLPNSPVLEARIAAGATDMSVRDLCEAAVRFSDSAAANILLAGIGGPQALTSFMRSIGDPVTRFDRREPDLNSNLPGDPQDTTSPRAMVDAMLRIFTQDVLTLTARAMLIDWMSAARTGLDRVRGGLPKGWQAADKTGTGSNGAVNDLAIAWPPGRRPIFIAVYMSESRLDAKELAAAQAEVGALVASQNWK